METQDLITKWEQKIVSIDKMLLESNEILKLAISGQCEIAKETILQFISDLKQLNDSSVKRSDEICTNCGKHIRMHSKGIIRPLCDCDV